MKLLMIQSFLSSLLCSSIILSTQLKETVNSMYTAPRLALCVSDNNWKFLARETSKVVMIWTWILEMYGSKFNWTTRHSHWEFLQSSSDLQANSRVNLDYIMTTFF
jgi:hypothetical protein